MQSQDHDQYDYRQILLQERHSRKLSQKSFAALTGLSTPYLCQIFSKDRSLSEHRAAGVAQRLGMNPLNTRYFLTLVRYENAKTNALRETIKKELSEWNTEASHSVTLKADIFSAVSRWHHGAIIELTRFKDFRDDPQWIASRLNISIVEAELALERLIRIGLLKRTAGELAPTNEGVFFGDIPSQAVRNHHRQVLERAIQAIEGQDFNERELRGKTMAIAKEQLPELRQLIDRFLQSVTQRSQPSTCDAVYQLSLQLFRLDTGGARALKTIQ